MNRKQSAVCWVQMLKCLLLFARQSPRYCGKALQPQQQHPVVSAYSSAAQNIMRCGDGAWTLGDNPNGDFMKNVCREGLNISQRKDLIRWGLNSTEVIPLGSSHQTSLPTLGPSFPGFPMGPLMPGSPCGQRSVHLRPQNTWSKTKKRPTRDVQRITLCNFLHSFFFNFCNQLPCTFSPGRPSKPCAPGGPFSPFCPGRPGTLVWHKLQAFCQVQVRQVVYGEKKKKGFIRLKRSTAF